MNIDDKDRERETDRWVDEALAEYSNMEPRSGLEGRVLARLAEARRESGRKLRWWGALALSAATILAVVLLWRAGTEPAHLPDSSARVLTPPKTEEQAATSQQPLSESTKHVGKNPSSTVPRGRPNSSVQAVVAQNNSKKNGWPKLERFPAPQPLSDQERMLARYVEEFPQRAALMARAQTELHQQDEREMAAPWPNANSDASEREE